MSDCEYYTDYGKECGRSPSFTATSGMDGNYEWLCAIHYVARMRETLIHCGCGSYACKGPSIDDQLRALVAAISYDLDHPEERVGRQEDVPIDAPTLLSAPSSAAQG